ncbi:MAG: helix-turn-helix domain-containing protein [Coriobacteriia bacterium]|nr:helix-turn-helix domain-containing protein [Coriobacteriia bacterium]
MPDRDQPEIVYVAPVQRLALTVEEAAAAIGISKNALYEDLIKRDAIPYLKFGRTIRIPVSALTKWLDEKAEEHATVIER